MKFPAEWLNQYLSKPMNARELAEAMELAGIEVEEIKTQSIDDLVVAGKVVSVRPHPNADKLRIAEVDVRKTTLSVVCGAPNLAEGQTVAVAKPGSVLQGGLEIKKAKIRGISSEGMICSEKELGVSEEHEGIMVLPDSLSAGGKVNAYLGAGEVIDATSPANRWDLNSVTAAAREIAAQTARNYVFKEPEQIVGSGSLKVGRIDKKLVGRYMLACIEVDASAVSPDWMRRRLRLAGLRPINIVVDVTNYVMLELGQPLHAFDAAKVDGPISVRLARKGEKLTTLDGRGRSLDPSDVVIADEAKVIGLAGVMGGRNTEISNSTTEIYLESASFNGASIRKTAIRQGARTDSSARFERGVPVNLQPIAMASAVSLLRQHAAAKVLAWPADVINTPPSEIKISVRPDKISALLGIKTTAGDIKKQLSKLGWSIGDQNSSLGVRVPWWRPDVTSEEDVAEEIIKLVGYAKLPATLPAWRPDSVSFDRSWGPRWQAKQVLRSMGWFETVTYSFISLEEIRGLQDDPRNYLALKNPKSLEQAYLRNNLLPSLLEVAGRNRAYSKSFGIFEYSKVYRPKSSGDLPHEPYRLGALYRGESGAFKQIKAALDLLQREFGTDIKILPTDFKNEVAHPVRSALIEAGGRPAGWLGQLHPLILNKYKLGGEAAYLELDWEAFLAAAQPKTYQEISRYPSIKRDLSVAVDRKVSWQQIREALRDFRAGFIGDYYSPTAGEGKKAITIRLEFVDFDRTLTDAQADKEAEKAFKILEHKFSAQLRS